MGLSRSVYYRLRQAALVLLLSACGQSTGANLSVDSAWVRAMPPGSKMTAAYFSLHNNSGEEVRIISVSSPEFSSASLHESVIEDGVSRMLEIPVLVLKPGESVHLEPGGKHLMLMGSHSGDIPGECCTLHLEIEGREPLRFHAGIGDQPQ